MQALALALKAKSLVWSWSSSPLQLDNRLLYNFTIWKIKLHATRKHLCMVSACQYHVTVCSLLECTTSDLPRLCLNVYKSTATELQCQLISPLSPGCGHDADDCTGHACTAIINPVYCSNALSNVSLLNTCHLVHGQSCILGWVNCTQVPAVMQYRGWLQC